MFFWLVAIPFFVIIAMFTLFRLPSSGLHEPEDIQDTAMAFRMVLQHDAAAKLMQEYQATGESDMFDEGSYDLGGDTWKETILGSGYLPSSFIPDTDNITTYIRCLNGLRQVASCRDATGIYMVTAATPPSGSSITTRWFEKKGAENLASQLKKYEGSFPVKPSGLVLPKKPRKEEDESDEAFAIRLNEYNETKAQYKLLKRNYYSFGTKLPRPNTTVGQVRAYPFGEETAESRVIVHRIKAIEGDVVFDKEYMPTDLPSGGEGSDSIDFNGEAVIFTASGSCNQGPCTCTKGTDCGAGVYCLSGTCSTGCGTYGFDANRTCYTTCTSDSQCPEGYFCDSGLCEMIPPFEPGDTVFSIANIGTMACYTYDSTIHSCTNTNTDESFTGAKELETYTIVSKGKYKISIKAEGYWFNYNSRGYTWDEGGAGGIGFISKEFAANTRLMFKIVGGVKESNIRWGGAGVAMYENDSLKLVFGGGGGNTTSGGGYVGGKAYRYIGGVLTTDVNGYGIDGTNTTYSTTICTSSSCPSGAYGGGYDQSYSSNGVPWRDIVYGGSSYIATDYVSLGTFTPGGNSTKVSQGYSAASYGNRAPGSVTITYCGNADSTCP